MEGKLFLREGFKLLISAIQPEQCSREQLTKLLFAGNEDDGRQGDCIFVFGSRSKERVVKAAELYQAGRAPYVLLSGGTRWGQFPIAEALRMKEQALALGIPESALLLETDSNHTGENVIASMLVLDRAIGLNVIRRLLVVTSPYHMRRSHLTLLTYMPPWIGYTLCPDGRKHGQADNWWNDPKESERVFTEAKSLVSYVRQQKIIDGEINW